MKLLIIKMSSLGDVVQAKELLPSLNNHEVDWVIEEPFKDLLEGSVSKKLVVDTKRWRKNPFKWFDEIKAFVKELRSTHYDAIIDLQGNIKSSFVLMFSRGSKKIGFGKKSVPEKINLLFTNDKVDSEPLENIRLNYQTLLKQAVPEAHLLEKTSHISPFREVLVCPGSAWTNKQLTVEALKDFLTCFEKEHVCRFHFLWGSFVEQKLADKLQSFFPGSEVIPKLSILDLDQKMKSMDLVISMDSFPLHLASSLNLPTISFFGPSSANKYRPLGDSAFSYQGACPYGKTFTKRCPILRSCPTGACLRSRKGEEMWQSIKEQLKITAK